MLTVPLFHHRSLDDGHLWSLSLQVILERLQGNKLCGDLLAMKGSMDRWVCT